MNNEKHKIVPELRFPEFDSEYKDVGFSDLGKIKIGLTHKPDYIESGVPFLSSKNISNGYIDFTDINYISQDKFLSMPDSTKPKVGDILFTRVGSNLGNPIIVEEDIEFGIFVSLGFFRVNNNVDNRYVRYWMDSDLFWRQVEQKVAGGAKMNLNTTWLKEFRLAIPTQKKEQQKIANCLSSLDDLINGETEKLDLLRDHKKGLLQQLFPAEGETQPQYRFPEFENDREWKEKELEDVCNIHNNRRKPISSSKRVKGNYPYYGASGIIDYVKNFIFDERLLLIGEDGAKWGAYEKTAFIVEGKYWVNNHAHVLEPTLIDDKLLENFLVKIDIHPFITGAAPPKLTLNNLKKIPVPVPPSVKEQQKIAKCLSSVDDLMDAQSKKIQALKKHKKGLMQQLFPNVNELTV